MTRHRLFRRRTRWDWMRQNMHIIVTGFALVAIVFGWSAMSGSEQPMASTQSEPAYITVPGSPDAESEQSSVAAADTVPAPEAIVDSPAAIPSDVAPVRVAQASPVLASPPHAVEPPAAPAPLMPLPRTKPIVPQQLQHATAEAEPERARPAKPASIGKARRTARAARLTQPRESYSSRRHARMSRWAKARERQVVRRQIRQQRHAVAQAAASDAVVATSTDSTYIDPFDCRARKNKAPCFR